MKDTYSDIKNTFNTLRNLNENKIKVALSESEQEMNTKDGESVPYTMDDEMMKSIVETTKTQFGADYTGFKNPMLYYPKDGDVILCGKVPSMNNLLFQFKYLADSGGCFIWTNYLTLTKDNLSKLNKIFGVYENWKSELGSMSDIKPMNLKNN